LITVLLAASTPSSTYAQKTTIDEKPALFTSFDIVPVDIDVDGKWSFETNIIITDSNLLFVNVVDLFNKLKIINEESDKENALAGFIGFERKNYLISYVAKEIQVETTIIKSENGLLENMGIKYIETSILSEAFGMTLTFNSSSLSAKLVCSFELPYVKQIRIENLRNSTSKLQGSPIAIDTTIYREYHLFKFGMLDWGINSHQTQHNISTNNLIVGVGAELLFGEANVSINYNDTYKFDHRQLQYSWRFIDNDRNIIKQVQFGKILNESIAFLEVPLLGLTLNNLPNTFRKASGTYIISDYIQPNWTVELLLNDVLVDYTTTDAAGLYVFNVPIVYGNTALKLKFYGPTGEERTEQRIINTPYTFTPVKTLEYSISGGVLEDHNGTLYGRGNFNYGFNRFFTFGGGLEYLSSIANRPFIPFAKAAFQPFNQMVLNFEYAHGVRTKGLLDYYLTENAFLQLDYTKHVKGQLATRFNALEERKIRISMPFKTSLFSGFSKLKFSQLIYESFNFNQIDFTFSSNYKQLSINSSLLVNWIGDKSPFMVNNLTFSYRLLNGFTFRPSLEYNLSNTNFTRFKAEIEKRTSKAYFSASYEKNSTPNNDVFFLNFRYDLRFARIGMSSMYTNKNLSFSENAQGSLSFGGNSNYVHSSNNFALGKGGILLYPFLDLNQNGILDKGEKMVLLTSVKVSGGTAVISAKDAIVRVSDLNAFVAYNVEFSNTDLQNISWKFKNESYQIVIDPNQYKRVFVPIVSLGEVNGTVFLSTGESEKGQGNIAIQVFDSKGKKVAEIVSESDGFYNYLGLKLGSYHIRLDDEQLRKLNYQSDPREQVLLVKASEDGTVVDGLDFKLQAIEIQQDQNQMLLVVNEKEKEQKLSEDIVTKSIEDIFGTKKLSHSINFETYKNDTTRGQLKYFDRSFYRRFLKESRQYHYGLPTTKERVLLTKKIVSFQYILGPSSVPYQFGKKFNHFNPLFQKEKELKRKHLMITDDTQINPNFNTSFKKIEDEPLLFYSVQIGVFNNYITSKYLLRFEPIFYEFMADGSIKYISGKYISKKEAKTARNKIIKEGVTDAYIVKYNDGKKIDTF
jgi:hypothetical protein